MAYHAYMAPRTLFTIGHSTRIWEEFLALLKAWNIEELIDVRTIPKSRMFPWFNKEKMSIALPDVGISYFHMPALGGLRRPKPASLNTGWQNANFRGYADYMQTPQFQRAMEELNERRDKKQCCIMCSEAVWWRCHRRMIADAECARHIPVEHIMGLTVAKPHVMTEFAVIQKSEAPEPIITYPVAASDEPSLPFA